MTRRDLIWRRPVSILPAPNSLTRVVPTTQLVDLFTTTHAAERIESYRLAMVEGQRFPPISVIRVGRRFVIADGHKRFRACQALGARHVTVELYTV